MSRLRHAALLVAFVLIEVHSQQSPLASWQRPRRQFIGSEWVPLSHPCPTCRQFADSTDNRPNYDDIGLVPPRPPPAARQVQGTSNFLQQNLFGQQRPRFPDFTFSQFPSPQQQQFPPQQQQFPPQQQQFPPQQQQFPSQQPQFPPQTPFYTPQEQQSFLPQTYLNNAQLLLNENPQLLPLVNNHQLLLNQQKPQLLQNAPKDNQIRFRPEGQRLDLRPPQNVRLEQDKINPTAVPDTHLQLPHNAAPAQFHVGPSSFGQQQQPFPQFQQPPPLLQGSTSDPPFITPPAPASTNSSDIVIPGLDKEEIQLLYVPVETLRQRGQLQGHTLEEARPPFFNQFAQFQQDPSGHFITQPPVSTASLTPSSLPSVTPPPVLTQNVPLRTQPDHFSTVTATATPLALSTTEQVVTIQPRPVSTVGQSDSRKTTAFSKTPSSQTTLSVRNSSPFSVASDKEIFGNEVTPSFSSPEGSQRYTPRPITESATETTFPTTTLQPHQPPLSIYVTSNQGPGSLSDILQELKTSESVAVIDNFSPNNPKVFVGPGNLNAPDYNKFDLPYLSNLEPSRIEQKDNLPFFVAPLNFNSPHGFSKIPFPAPHVGAVVYSDEPEPEITTLPETTTTVRSRGRRPSSSKQSLRRPVSSTRPRVTQPPQEVEVTSENDSQIVSQKLRESQQERKRLSPSRRQRVRTTTEAVTEAAQASDLHHETIQTQTPLEEVSSKFNDFDATQVPQQKLQEPIYPPVDFQQERPQTAHLKHPQYPRDDFVPPPPPSAFDTKLPSQPQLQYKLKSQFPSPAPIFQQFETPKFEMFHPTPEEIQGIFNLPSPSPRPAEDDSPVQAEHVTQNEFTTLLSSNNFREDNEEPVIGSEEEGKEVESLDIPRKAAKYTNVPVDKLEAGANQVRAPVQLRPRGSTTTAPGEDFENNGKTLSATEPPKVSKYLNNFNRSRKPLRTTSPKPETTTSVPSTKSHTVRPLRRSTIRTSVSTKRIRKPTTPLPYNDEDTDEQSIADPQFAPSGVSNEIIDERPLLARPKPRKPYFPKKKLSLEQTTINPSTKIYQERADEVHPEDEHTGVTGSDSHASSPQDTVVSYTEASNAPIVEEKKKVYDAEQKKTRRRLRVKVQKRPQDNFETAESQNHGSVTNLLVPSSHKPTAPDLYRFGKGEFDFENTGKFIATHNKAHARNITADILESTDSFSSPGSDTTVQQVTIVSDQTTIMPESSAAALVSNPLVDEQTSSEAGKTSVPTENNDGVTIAHETTTPSTTTTTTEAYNPTKRVLKEDVTETAEEVTTQADVLGDTTIATDVTSPITTTTITSTSTNEPKQRRFESSQRKVLRTTTTTQVSHETEICYKGKCIKTNSNNPELALKRLVEQANSEDTTKVKT